MKYELVKNISVKIHRPRELVVVSREEMAPEIEKKSGTVGRDSREGR